MDFSKNNVSSESLFAKKVFLLCKRKCIDLTKFSAPRIREKSSTAVCISAKQMLLQCLGIAFLFQLCCELVRLNSLTALAAWLPTHLPAFFIGAGAIFGLLVLACGLFRRPWASVVVVGGILFGFSYASFYKAAYRHDPMLPADLLLALDAAGVAGGMDLSPTVWMIVFFVVLAALVWILRRQRCRLCWQGLVGTVCGIGVWLSATLWFGPLPDLLQLTPVVGHASTIYDRGGFVCGFCSYLGQLFPQKPAGYSDQSAQQALDALPTVQAESSPDIIVVMMESYYHLENYQNITGCDNLTENYNLLAKEGVSGYYYSDKYSGGTADMEFGALTGFSTSFLPDGVVPYIQYVAKDEDFPAYPAYLKQLGYQTIAIHPFDGGIYKRSDAYPNMGFDTFIDEESMTYTQTKGKYISDGQAANELIAQYESAVHTGNPVFMHMVTMQNHIPNLPGEYPADQQVNAEMEGVSEYYNDSLKSVATGLADADKMMKQITDYFRTVDREVIVLFFGDHQTAIGQDNGVELLDVTGELNGMSDLEQWQAMHKVPYLMWSNQGCENAGTDGGSFPPYMLMPVFLSEMDAPLSPWFAWLSESRSQCMGLTGGWIIQPDGSFSRSAADSQQAQLLNTQHTLQYAMMFDN